ncbi:CrcB family protein [Schaalia sp. 19OD2882]|uniref:fluoride efflux transporter FluC n=1 Tax=Schaalia sp. 19OD2882 TaxID=2794089 RepID=UPI0020A7082A|nr:CrcB family protein [Schaalia sp. 19OD2882]
MTPAVMICASILGGLGALARWTMDSAVNRWLQRRCAEAHRPNPAIAPTPWMGIAAVNVLGCLLIGTLVGVTSTRIPGALARTVTTILAGGFTTFSSAVLDCMALLRRGAWTKAATALIGVWLVSVLACGVGMAIGSL